MFRLHAMRWFTQSPDGRLWRPDPGGGGGGTAVANPAAPAAPAPAPAGGGAPAPASPAPAAVAPAAPAGTNVDNRGSNVPAYRLVEETRERQRIQKQLDEANTSLDQERRRVRALSGVDPADPAAAEAQKVVAAFFNLPGVEHLAKLTPDTVEKIAKMIERGEGLEEAANYQWNQLALQTLNSVDAAAMEHYGATELTARQQEKLHAAFWQFAKRDPETFRQRYENRDPKLIDEFMAEYVEDVVAPIRRLATTAVPRPRPVPRGGPSVPVVQAPPKIDFTDPQAVEDEAVRRMKDAGYLRER